MAKAEAFQDLALTTPRRSQELWRWLYSEIRAAILDGRLKRGSRLPSERSLAKQYGLARGTVTAAFDQLRAEGYASSEIGSGTFVASGLPEDGMVARRVRRGPALPKSRAGLSARGRMMVDGVLLLPPSQSIGKAFRNYEPAIDLFPMNLWARIAGRVLRRAPRTLYAQGNAAGFEPLRRAIAEYLGAARGVKCDAGQVIVTSGAQQALDLTARLLLEPGDSAWVEDPCYPGSNFHLTRCRSQHCSDPRRPGGLESRGGAKGGGPGQACLHDAGKSVSFGRNAFARPSPGSLENSCKRRRLDRGR